MQRLAITISFDVSLLALLAGLVVMPCAAEVDPVAIELTTTPEIVPMSTLPLREQANPTKRPGACTDEMDFTGVLDNAPDGIPEEVITRTFDSQGRAVLEDWARNDAPHRTLEIEYDAKGRRVLERLRLFEGRDVWLRTFTYDANDRIVVESLEEYGEKREVFVGRRTYDSKGRLATMREPGGGLVTYRYDEHGRLAVEKIHGGERKYEYDYNNRLQTIFEQSGARLEHIYDVAGNLVAKEYRIRDLGPLARTIYTYDCF